MIVIKQPNYNFLAIPHKLYIPRMTVVGNKSMDFANLCQCKLNSFANKNVCKQDDKWNESSIGGNSLKGDSGVYLFTELPF